AIQLQLETGNAQSNLSSKTGAVRVEANGDLLIQMASDDVRFLKPVVYQIAQGNRQSVDGRFVLMAGNRVGFEVGAYDKTRSLIIDPVLSYSTFLGGVAAEAATGIAVDSSGNAYVSGFTCTNNSCDATVTKLNAAGTAVVYSSILGGSDEDQANAIALD